MQHGTHYHDSGVRNGSATTNELYVRIDGRRAQSSQPIDEKKLFAAERLFSRRDLVEAEQCGEQQCIHEVGQGGNSVDDLGSILPKVVTK